MIDQNKYIHFTEMYMERLNQTFKKKNNKWAGIVIKSEKRSGKVRKDYH